MAYLLSPLGFQIDLRHVQGLHTLVDGQQRNALRLLKPRAFHINISMGLVSIGWVGSTVWPSAVQAVPNPTP